MLFLTFRIGKDRYVLDARQVEEVLPLVAAKALPGAPSGIAGLISYHGQPVPLLDLALLATGQPVAEVMSSRIILLRYPEAGEGAALLALAAEEVIATVKRAPSDFVPTGVEAGMPAYLGPVAADADGLLQWVKAPALLSDDIRAILFRQVEPASGEVRP
ncbi:chemotaxis protein CheW [Ancylobacter sp. SL191]|uniref:chemotaxis protein CheW n=1 Tax=Ancylobacter sp. SL191 TaxID=2995166 RepID=UPI00226E56E7|nr:chemotaxis protein CheW [Ancylobacter sp. SL191]WAC28496.1 chemotaxis protein CheW [Ancylobacter sp. SL191]